MQDQLGFGYQIRNDLDGLVSDPELESPDLDVGKRTFVLWTAYQRLDEVGRNALADALTLPAGPERRASLLALIWRSGAELACRQRLKSIRRSALAALRTPSLTAPQRRAFAELLAWFGSGQSNSSQALAVAASSSHAVFSPEVQG